MNIEELVRIHDKNQFEIKLGYLINPKKKTTEYNINLYFFIPKNLGIDKYSYSKEHFFEDFYSYVRLITPKDTIKNLTKRLDKLLSFIETKKVLIDKNFEHINYELKITVCAYKAYLRDFVKVISKHEYYDEDILEFIQDIKEFRNRVKKISSFAKFSKSDKLKNLFKFADEYTSFLVNVYLIRLLSVLKRNNDMHLFDNVKEYIQEEVQYRKENRMSYVSNIDSKNELLLYKYSVYKKYFYNILFLHQKRREDATELRHFAYAIAAGIAMIFATAAAFIAQKKYGNFTTSFFIALVISYMFKDRIKDYFRQVFDNKFVFRKVYDFRNKIYDLERFKLFGFYKERVRFIKESEIPKRVLDTRLKNTDTHLSTWFLGENVLKYEKKIKLYNDKIQSSFADEIEGLNDIVRFNISKFTKKMDDPETYLYSIIDGKIKKIKASKVYHLNIVIEFQSEDEHHLFKIRLILTKEGIKRIEMPLDDAVIVLQKSHQDLNL